MVVRMDLDRLNSTPADDLRPVLHAVCSTTHWVDAMIDGRPYATADDAYERSDEAVAALDDEALEAALAGHPRIGDRPAGKHAAWSTSEQATMSDAAEDIAAQIRDGNLAYEQRFGHVYLVCASGRRPEELLAILRSRLDNEPADEHAVVLSELAAINRLRLTRLVEPTDEADVPGR